MDVKEAVKTAKDHASIIFAGETPRIEEVWFDEFSNEWCVTIGLQRAEREAGLDLSGLTGSTRAVPTRIHYKTIRIDDATKAIKSVKIHDTVPVSTR